MRTADLLRDAVPSPGVAEPLARPRDLAPDVPPTGAGGAPMPSGEDDLPRGGPAAPTMRGPDALTMRGP